jgi:hypothetical protein
MRGLGLLLKLPVHDAAPGGLALNLKLDVSRKLQIALDDPVPGQLPLLSAHGTIHNSPFQFGIRVQPQNAAAETEVGSTRQEIY